MDDHDLLSEVEHIIGNKVWPDMARNQYASGSVQCQKCLDAYKTMLAEVRALRNRVADDGR